MFQVSHHGTRNTPGCLYQSQVGTAVINTHTVVGDSGTDTSGAYCAEQLAVTSARARPARTSVAPASMLG